MKKLIFIISLCAILSASTLYTMKRPADTLLESVSAKKISLVTLTQEHHEFIETNPLFTMEDSNYSDYNPLYMPNFYDQSTFSTFEQLSLPDEGRYAFEEYNTSFEQKNTLNIDMRTNTMHSMKLLADNSLESLCAKKISVLTHNNLTQEHHELLEIHPLIAMDNANYSNEIDYNAWHMQKNPNTPSVIEPENSGIQIDFGTYYIQPITQSTTIENIELEKNYNHTFYDQSNFSTFEPLSSPEKAPNKGTCTFEEYNTENNLNIQMQPHTGKNPYACTFEGCGKSFVNTSLLNRHMLQTHPEEKPHVCTFEGCDKSFKYNQSLTIHMQTHTGKNPYACTFKGCNQSSINKATFNRHMRTHTGEKPYICTFENCNKSYADKRNLDNHEQKHRVEKQEHTRKNPCVCPFEGCDRSFEYPYNLNRHMLIHSKEKTHVCPFEGCDKAFKHNTNLNTHIKTHTEK